MSDQTFSVPHGKNLTRGQPKSIQDTIHVLRHGAIEGTGTARGALLADEMGTGKTIVAIVAANTLGFRRILVICPAHLRETTWVNEIRAWQTLGHLVVPVKATSQYDPAFLPSITSGWVIINYDILGRHPEIKAHPMGLADLRRVTFAQELQGKANVRDLWGEISRQTDRADSRRKGSPALGHAVFEPPRRAVYPDQLSGPDELADLQGIRRAVLRGRCRR